MWFSLYIHNSMLNAHTHTQTWEWKWQNCYVVPKKRYKWTTTNSLFQRNCTSSIHSHSHTQTHTHTHMTTTYKNGAFKCQPKKQEIRWTRNDIKTRANLSQEFSWGLLGGAALKAKLFIQIQKAKWVVTSHIFSSARFCFLHNKYFAASSCCWCFLPLGSFSRWTALTTTATWFTMSFRFHFINERMKNANRHAQVKEISIVESIPEVMVILKNRDAFAHPPD